VGVVGIVDENSVVEDHRVDRMKAFERHLAPSTGAGEDVERSVGSNWAPFPVSSS